MFQYTQSLNCLYAGLHQIMMQNGGCREQAQTARHRGVLESSVCLFRSFQFFLHCFSAEESVGARHAQLAVLGTDEDQLDRLALVNLLLFVTTRFRCELRLRAELALMLV